jgi:ribose transport system ATP-binding protein
MQKSAVKTIIKIRGISKAFPGIQALNDVNIDVSEGEIHGLVGKNGAGKSTLMAILMGLEAPDAGTVEIDEHLFTKTNPHEALEAGVAYVPQHVSMMDSLTVAENILAGEMPVNKLGFISWNRVFEDAEQRLHKLGLKLNVRANVEGLGVAEQTMLAIAKVLFRNAKLIILDEPTATLHPAEVDRLFEFIRSLKAQHVAFIYISHHVEEVFEICDRVTVMRNGQVVTTRTISGLVPDELIRLMIGENLKDYERASAVQKDEALVIDSLTRRGHYENIRLTIHRGEVVGISGLEGSGASSLGMALFGLQRKGVGFIKIDGKSFTARSPQEALSQGLAYLPQDRYQFGLVGSRPVRENITYSILNQLSFFLGIINTSQENKMVDYYIQDLSISCTSREQKVNNLSGGNQQKVIFAKLAATKPTVLVLHEPTQGIDVRAKTDIYRIIDRLSSQGVGIIIISTEVRELMGVCDRILVMHEGHITDEFRSGDEQTTPSNILQAIREGNAHV